MNIPEEAWPFILMLAGFSFLLGTIITVPVEKDEDK